MLKINSFGFFNVFMVGFCIFTFCINYTSVNIVNNDKAISKVSNDVFEYSSTKDFFIFSKNGRLVGMLPADRKFEFKKQYIPNFCCNVATAGLAGVAAAGVAAGSGIIVKEGADEISKGVDKNKDGKIAKGIILVGLGVFGIVAT